MRIVALSFLGLSGSANRKRVCEEDVNENHVRDVKFHMEIVYRAHFQVQQNAHSVSPSSTSHGLLSETF